MKHLKFLLLFVLCFGFYSGIGQSILLEFNMQRLNTTKAGMKVLGSWAIGNFGYSGISLAEANGSSRYFHQMNLYWNVVNLGLAGSGLINANKVKPSDLDLSQSIHEQHKIEKLLLFNAGLDLAYIAGGLWMRERSNNISSNSDLWKGYGNSVILQGSFLLVFDAMIYQQIRKNKISPLLQQSTFNISGNGFYLAMKF
jgi:hypothetical protein